jgi:GWxTD domain-containing protein
MKFLKLFVIFFLSQMVFPLYAQYMSSPQLSGVGLPFFRSGIFRTFSEDGQKRIVKIYLQILNDDLTFLKGEDSFFGELQYEVYVNNKDNEAVFNRTVNERVNTINYEETNSRQIFNTFVTEVELPPGEYEAVITVLDKNNNKQVNRKIKFNLEAINGLNFLISDIMFFQKFEQDSSGQIINFEPSLLNNFSGGGKYIYFYFTSVVKNPQDTLKINYKILDPRKFVNQSNEYLLVDKPVFNKHFVRINREQFDQNRYEVELNAECNEKVMTSRKLFSFFWTTSPNSPKDLDLALEQMRYIVDADSVGWALKQKYEDKSGYFDRFWKRMDPNPDTEKNELLDEYFMRVNFATQNFSTITTDGWKTDRGRIFIKFGQPEDIERYPFQINSHPFEIWRYYSLRKEFLFEDRTGFGEYYLHPSYYDEEYN